MIAKLTTGNGFSGTLKYDLRDGQLVEKRGAVPEHVSVLDAKDVCFDYDEEGNMVLDVKQVAWDFRQQAMAYGGRNPIEKPVYHWALAYHPNDNVSDEQMLKDTEEFLDKMGFGNTQYVVIAHRDTDHPHVHVIANIVDNDGKRIPTYKMIDKAHKEAARITKDRGYTWGEKASKKTIENAHKPHEKVRMNIEPIIKKAVAESISFGHLKQNLAVHGITCKVKEAKDGKRGGISFGYEYDGQTHSYSGSSVNRQLSFGYISKTIAENEIASRTVTYMIHSRTDASVYYLGPQYTGAYKVLEPLRQALVDRGYMVSFEGKEGYERDLRMHDKYPDFRIGRMRLEDDKVRFGKEKIFGDPEKTAPAFVETPEVTPRPTPQPEPQLKPQPSHQPHVKTIQELAKLKNLKPGGQESTKEAINKAELLDNDDNDKKKSKGIRP